MPSAEMAAVIEGLMNSAYLEDGDHQGVNFDAALTLTNRVLKRHKLEVALDTANGVARLRAVDGRFVSTAHHPSQAVEKITFAPRVFGIPQSSELQHDLVAVMMPFGTAFSPVYDAIKMACAGAELRCVRADDIWSNSAIIQDIVDLIFVTEIVVVDFAGKNPNVMYETGIAHTLGKHVPVTQSIEHVPFDLQQHRTLVYHPNREGLAKLTDGLAARLLTIKQGHGGLSAAKTPVRPSS